jgi:hypothetical protein
MRTLVVRLVLLLALLPSAAHAQRSELEAYAGGGFGFRGGVGLSDRWLLQLGVELQSHRFGAGSGPDAAVAQDLRLTASFGAKVYLRDPQPDSLAPFLRALGSIGVTRNGSNCCAVWGHTFGASAGGGVTYFFGARVGLGVEVGVNWSERRDVLNRQRSIYGTGAVLLTLRLGADPAPEAPRPPVVERRRRPLVPRPGAGPETSAPAANAAPTEPSSPPDTNARRPIRPATSAPPDASTHPTTPPAAPSPPSASPEASTNEAPTALGAEEQLPSPT